MENIESNNIIEENLYKKFIPRYLKSALSPFENKEKFIWYLIITFLQKN